MTQLELYRGVISQNKQVIGYNCFKTRAIIDL